MRVFVFVPARLASSRFPGKLLSSINGKPLLQHTLERISENGLEPFTTILHDNEETYTQLHKIAHILYCDHPSIHTGTGRIQYFVKENKALFKPDDFIINWQAEWWDIKLNVWDLPAYFDPERYMPQTIVSSDIKHTTLCTYTTDHRDDTVTGMHFWRNGQEPPLRITNNLIKGHIGIYGFHVKTLLEHYYDTPADLEQNNWKCPIVCNPLARMYCEPGVDTPEDAERMYTTLTNRGLAS